jgi:hypothetical protein
MGQVVSTLVARLALPNSAMSGKGHITNHDDIVTWLTSHATEGTSENQTHAAKLLQLRINEIRAAKVAVAQNQAAVFKKAPLTVVSLASTTLKILTAES